MYRLSYKARFTAMAAARTTESRQTRMSSNVKNTQSKILSLFIALMTVGASLVLAPLAHADSFDDQIRALNQANSQNQTAVGGLEAQEVSLASVLADLRNKIAALEAQIRDN